MRLRVRARRPRLLASSASLEPSSSTAAQQARPGELGLQLAAEALQELQALALADQRRVEVRRAWSRPAPAAGSGSSRAWPATGSGHGPAGSGSPVAAAKKEAAAVAGAHRPGPLLAGGGGLGDRGPLQAAGAPPLDVDLGIGQVAPEERAQDLVEASGAWLTASPPRPSSAQRRRGGPHRQLLPPLGAPAGAGRLRRRCPPPPPGSAGPPPGRAARRAHRLGERAAPEAAGRRGDGGRTRRESGSSAPRLASGR